MTTQYVEYKKKKYVVKEPTINDWSEIMRLKGLLDDQELNYKLMEKITGMPKEIILSAKLSEINKIGQQLYTFLNLEQKQLFPDFEFKGKTYKIVNISKISFGQFVDIDTFLSKDESYRISNLHELAAYMYNEVIDGEVIEYGKIDFKKQSEEFKELPIKYLEGAIFFLSILGRASQGLTQIYSHNKWQWMRMIGELHLAHIGDGISRLANWLKTKFGKLIKLSVSPLRRALTTLHTYWTRTKKKSKR
jgi:hypothetical protein